MENKRQLIYADDAKRAIEHYDPAFSYVIDNVPTVEAVEVVHGHWIYHLDYLFPTESTQECSICHEHEETTLYNENYCPNCGAKMDGDIYE